MREDGDEYAAGSDLQQRHLLARLEEDSPCRWRLHRRLVELPTFPAAASSIAQWHRHEPMLVILPSRQLARTCPSTMLSHQALVESAASPIYLRQRI